MRTVMLWGPLLGMAGLAWALPLLAFPLLTWHDQQRIGQILIAFFAFLGLIRLMNENLPPVEAQYRFGLAAIVFLGVLSAAGATYPLYAFAEWSLLVISIGIGVFVFSMRQSCGSELVDTVLGLVLRILLGSMVAQLYVSFLAVWGHVDLFFTPWMLLNGFSNMRHGGMFLAVATPLLMMRLEFEEGRFRGAVPSWLDSILIASLSCMIFVAGTRGTVIGWIASSLVVSLLSKEARSMAKRFLWLILIGFVLAWGVLRAANFATGQVADFRFSGTQMMGFSGREALWSDAFNAMLSHPWLGVGPMHFAALKNPIATHPHQALLQIGSEWGIPVLVITLCLVFSWGRSAFQMAIAKEGARESGQRWSILIALCSVAVQGLVDGILVMPYVEIWLATTFGWAASVFYEPRQHVDGTGHRWLIVIMALALSVLLYVFFADLPKLIDAPEYCSTGPRFWCDGRL